MRRAFSILGGIGLGLALSQFPEYAQQYVQRLGGAVDELRTITAEFDRAAEHGGLTREQALVRYQDSTDRFLAGRGAAMEQTFERYGDLSAKLERVQGAAAWERLQLLPEFLDSEIGGRTLDNFKPAVPVTPEGFAYAGGGVLIGYALVSGVLGLLSLPFRRRKVLYRSTAN